MRRLDPPAGVLEFARDTVESPTEMVGFACEVIESASENVE